MSASIFGNQVNNANPINTSSDLVTMLNAASTKTLTTTQKITFPNRKDRQELSRIAQNGLPYYWMVALSLSEGNLVDVKDATKDPFNSYCVIEFNLSNHSGYKTPYILNENEVLKLKGVTQITKNTQNIYYFNFAPSENRFNFRCFLPSHKNLTLEDFQKTIDGIFKLKLDLGKQTSTLK